MAERPRLPRQPLESASTPKRPMPKTREEFEEALAQIDPERLKMSRNVLERVMDPSYLEMISGATGFNYRVVDEPAPGLPDYVIGYTIMRTKCIYIVRKNITNRMLELELEGNGELMEQELRGLLRHEGGHHAPEVLALDTKFRAILNKPELEPSELQEFFNDPKDKGETKRLFWEAFYYDICNASLDVWLEAFQARGSFAASAGIDFLALHRGGEGRDFLKEMPLHHQLAQWLVGEEVYLLKGEVQRAGRNRITKAKQLAILEAATNKLLRPEVAKIVNKLRADGVPRALVNVDQWGYLAANDASKAGAINLKFQVVMEHVYPAWRKLFLMEFDRRKKELKEKMEGEGELSDEEVKAEQHKLLKELLEQAKKDGKKAFASETGDPEDGDKVEGIFKGIQESAGSPPSKGEQMPARAPSALDQARARLSQGLDDLEKQNIGELAGRFGVSEESLRKAQAIEEKFSGEITRMAQAIAEAFVNQRSSKRKENLLEGYVTSGLEDVTHQLELQGDQDVRTHEIMVEAAEFLKTEVVHLIDTSGSMHDGVRLDFAQTMCTILIRVFEKVKGILQGEGLLDPLEEDPLRTGIIVFTDSPSEVKKLSEPTQPSTTAQMVEQTNNISGGTNDAAAIDALTNRFAMGDPTVLKCMVIYSDGEGNPEAVKNILDAIDKDQSIIVVICAMGANSASVAQTYGELAKSKGASVIHVVEGDNITSRLPELTEFLKITIVKAAERLTAV